MLRALPLSVLLVYLAITFLLRKNNKKNLSVHMSSQKLIDSIVFRELQQSCGRPKVTDDSGNTHQKDTEPLLFKKCKLGDIFFPGTVTRLQNH